MTRFCNTPWRGVLLVLVGAIPGGFPGTVAGEERALVVHPVNHLPVGDLANTIAALLEDMRDDESLGDVRLATEVIGNRLVVRGAPEAVQRVTALVTQLDQRPQTVLVEVTVAAVACKEAPGRIPIQADGSTTADQILQALAQQGDVRVVARAQLSTINNQPAYVQLGRREPTVRGVMQSSRGQTRQVEMENVGIKLSLTPRMNPDGTVTLETDLERSDVGTAERSVELGPGGERADAIDVLSLQTTVCAKSGQTVVLGSLTERRGDGWTKLIALLTPQVLP